MEIVNRHSAKERSTCRQVHGPNCSSVDLNQSRHARTRLRAYSLDPMPKCARLRVPSVPLAIARSNCVRVPPTSCSVLAPNAAPRHTPGDWTSQSPPSSSGDGGRRLRSKCRNAPLVHEAFNAINANQRWARRVSRARVLPLTASSALPHAKHTMNRIPRALCLHASQLPKWPRPRKDNVRS